jgi:hypothetical protein
MRILQKHALALAILTVFLIALFLFSFTGLVEDDVAAFRSVEVGVATLGPAGIKGGFAIPASCPSYEHTPGECVSSPPDPPDPPDPVPPPQCSNGEDDDGDGLFDFPADLGCTSATDNNESAPSAVLDIEAQPNLVRQGGETTIAWSAENVQNCTVSGPAYSDSFTAVPPDYSGSGSGDVTDIQNEQTYTLSCTDLDNQSDQKIEIVRVLPAFQEQ